MTTLNYQQHRADLLNSSKSENREDPGMIYMNRRGRDITLCNFDKNSNAVRERAVAMLASKDLPKTAGEGWKFDLDWVDPVHYKPGGTVEYNTPLTCNSKTDRAKRRAVTLLHRKNLPVTAATGWNKTVKTTLKKWNAVSKNKCATPRLYGAARWR